MTENTILVTIDLEKENKFARVVIFWKKLLCMNYGKVMGANISLFFAPSFQLSATAKPDLIIKS